MQGWQMVLLEAARPVTPLLRLVTSSTRACAAAVPCTAIHVLADDRIAASIPQQQGIGSHGVRSPAVRCFSTSHPSLSVPEWLSPQLATGGIVAAGAMVTGLALAALRGTVEMLLEAAKRQLFVCAELDSRDDAYRWLMVWLAQHPSLRNSPRISITTSPSAFGSSGLEGSLAGAKKVMLLPAPGDHMINHQGRWLWLSRRRATGAAGQSNVANRLVETLTISAWGRDRQVLVDLVAAAEAAYNDSTRQRTVVYSLDQDGYWDRVGSRPLRPMSTVVLPGQQAEELLSDVMDFLGSEAWYSHRGIPYRRGYLLYGVPGSGKTSLVTALAGALALDIYVLSLSSPSITDDTLRQALNRASDRCILLLEDIDAAFVGREGQASTSSSLSFSGLLNAIDGVAAQEGRLLFMTTNHIERLSPALIRPGRVDYRCEFKNATKEQARRLFAVFYSDTTAAQSQDLISSPASGRGVEVFKDSSSGSTTTTSSRDRQPGPGTVPPDSRAAVAAGGEGQEHGRARAAGMSSQELEKLAQQFASNVPEDAVSMAALQGFLMRHKHSPRGAAMGVAAWVQAQSTPGNSSTSSSSNSLQNLQAAGS